ncbi:hypothetical protein B0T16DRAFT_393219 [Cercophora newfieldiana]|uniref:Uncharacterized protein n=1 Tax=Cercophora newfieldiana TaxID=92897 RepID=A0AA39XV69_9PEZI|nr:hypothetical protein B0T16DRAFT_393219 [Cercophora newfieldiana]
MARKSACACLHGGIISGALQQLWLRTRCGEAQTSSGLAGFWSTNAGAYCCGGFCMEVEIVDGLAGDGVVYLWYLSVRVALLHGENLVRDAMMRWSFASTSAHVP